MSLTKSIAKAIYLKLSVSIPQPHVFGHIPLSILMKFIESNKRICLAMNFS